MVGIGGVNPGSGRRQISYGVGLNLNPPRVAGARGSGDGEISAVGGSRHQHDGIAASSRIDSTLETVRIARKNISYTV
jgi:hypothetical protein